MNDARTGKPRVPDDGHGNGDGESDGIFTWHSTRIDDAGRLALTRLDGDLRPVWHSTLPLSEIITGNPISTWSLAGRVVMTGQLQTQDTGVTSRVPQLVSVDLQTGDLKSTALAE